jgi:heme A synthase
VVAFWVRVRRDAQSIAALKRLSIFWVALVACQITLGAWTIWSNKAADVATAHVAFGAIMLSFGVSITAICWRISQRAAGAPRQPGAPEIVSGRARPPGAPLLA